ncbi:MAG: histidine kinase [Ornithinimicrobium sp.]
MRRAIPATTVWGEVWRLTVATLAGVAIFIGAFTFIPGRGDIAWLGDAAVGVACLVLVLWRRTRPLTIALVIVVASAFSAAASGAALLAMVSLATRRVWREWLIVLPVWMLSPLPFEIWYPTDGQPDYLGSVITQVLAFAASVGVGAAIGSQRHAMAALQGRAESAEAEQASRIARAQADERAKIAREMHDVLAHRISLIAMHSGALAYRDDLPREQVKQTAELLRDNADLAVGELREVLGVLRQEGEVDQSRAPQPDLLRLDDLIAEDETGDIAARLDLAAGCTLDDVPQTASRTAYRVVQEALTNARKHAPGMPVSITIGGDPERGLLFEIRNPPTDYGTPRIVEQSSGMGLIGLTERVNLGGGTLAYGSDRSGDYVVHGRLPWRDRVNAG